MFEELLEQYHNLPIESKREKSIEELKLVIALLQILCERKKIKYNDIKINDISEFEDESKYLDTIYAYITSLKEQLGSYIINTEKR